jgi:hypothetical protein
MISSPCRWITLVGLLLSSPAAAATQVEASAASTLALQVDRLR